MTDDARLLSAFLRRNLSRFIHKCFLTVAPGRRYRRNWHIDVIAWHLQECLTGNIKRLIITLPPRHLKSICASVAFPAWALGHDPSLRIIAASYSTELARRHALDCRSVIEEKKQEKVGVSEKRREETASIEEKKQEETASGEEEKQEESVGVSEERGEEVANVEGQERKEVAISDEEKQENMAELVPEERARRVRVGRVEHRVQSLDHCSLPTGVGVTSQR